MDRRVLRLFLVNWAIGITLGLSFAAALLAFDIGKLRTLMFQTDFALPGIAMLFGGFAITFGGVVCGSAVMFNAGKEPETGSNGSGTPEFIPILATNASKR